MARPRQISDERLLEIARQVFLEHGAAASVDLVAERAGISAPAIFRRFGTKDRLFAEAMRPPEDIPPFVRLLEDTEGLEQLSSGRLYDIACAAYAFMKEVAPLSMQVWAAHADAPPPLVAFDRLVQILRERIAEGRFPVCDPEAFALMFFGAIYSLAILHTLQNDPPDAEPSLRAVTRMALDYLSDLPVQITNATGG